MKSVVINLIEYLCDSIPTWIPGLQDMKVSLTLLSRCSVYRDLSSIFLMLIDVYILFSACENL